MRAGIPLTTTPIRLMFGIRLSSRMSRLAESRVLAPKRDTTRTPSTSESSGMTSAAASSGEESISTRS